MQIVKWNKPIWKAYLPHDSGEDKTKTVKRWGLARGWDREGRVNRKSTEDF